MLFSNTFDKDNIKNYPVSWNLTRPSTALTMQYKEVGIDEPCFERLQESPMAFKDVQPYSATLTDATIEMTYDDIVTELKLLGTNNTNVIYQDYSQIVGSTPLTSLREMGGLKINDDGVKPVFVIHTATHGDEHDSYAGTLAFINNYLVGTDELSTWMRNNVCIYWVAIPNPDGVFNGVRNNDNDVNLNRNWDHFWEFAPDLDKGSAPMDQIENQNTLNFLTPILSRVITFFDIHGWTSRTTYGFLTDQMWVGDIRAYKQQRAAYLYIKSILEKRDWSGFTIANELPTPVERKSSKKPYIGYALRKQFRADAWSGQFEYTKHENVGVAGTVCMDALTGVAMGTRDALAPERVGVVCTPTILNTDLVNNNAHLDGAWQTGDNRPSWFTSNNLVLQNDVLVNPHYTDTQLVSNKPAAANWPYTFSEAGKCIVRNDALESKGHLYIIGGEISTASYTSSFYSEELQPVSPPTVSDGAYGTYQPTFGQEALPNAPYAAKSIAMSTDGVYIYIYGGYDGTTYYNDIYRILIVGLSTNVWELVHTVTHYGGGLQRHQMDYWNGNLVISGGRTSGGYRDDILKIDTTTWTETLFLDASAQPFFSSRGWHTTTVVGDTLYTFGGWNGSSAFSSGYAIGLSTQSRVHHPMSTSRREASCAYNSTDNRIYITGGVSTSGDAQDIIYFDVTTPSYVAFIYTLDTETDEDGNVYTIDAPYRTSHNTFYNNTTDEIILIGGKGPSGVRIVNVNNINMESAFISERNVNDATWGYIRASSSFTGTINQNFVLSVAVKNLSSAANKSSYVRPTLYLGALDGVLRKLRLGYSVPPDNDWHIFSVPVPVHAGFEPTVRAYLRHYSGGSRVIVGAMQLSKNHLHGTLVPPTGKSSDTLVTTFDNPIDGTNSIAGVFSPMWGSQQTTGGEITALDFDVGEGDLQELSLTYESTSDGVATDLSTYSYLVPTGNFRARWTILGVAYSHLFPVFEINHDRFVVGWKKDVIHWKLRSEGDTWFFDLWFYNNLQSATLGTTTGQVNGFTINGSSIVSKIS